MTPKRQTEGWSKEIQLAAQKDYTVLGSADKIGSSLYQLR
jgi:hypothetical protein